MYTDIHTDFILTPICTILEQGINASQSLPSGIESYPISEYHLQSLFLRMTGASEQKMKCILWQMATDDFEYRYRYLNYQGMGECSTYSSKNVVFRDLVSQITKRQPSFVINNIWSDFTYDEDKITEERKKWEDKVKKSKQAQIDHLINKSIDNGKSLTDEQKEKMKAGIMKNAFKEEDFANHLDANKRRSVISQLLAHICSLLQGTNLAIWRTTDFENFTKYSQKVIKGCEVAETNKDGLNLFCGSMVKMYESLVYLHRNRTAHNTVVYQQNLPALSTLASKDYYLQNYFSRFALIIVMDEIFLRLYQTYLQVYAQQKV